MAKSKSTKSLKSKTTADSQPTTWQRSDDLHTRLDTWHRGIYYIGDHATDEASSAFFMVGKAVEHEYEAVGAMLDGHSDMPGSAKS